MKVGQKLVYTNIIGDKYNYVVLEATENSVVLGWEENEMMKQSFTRDEMDALIRKSRITICN